MSTLTAANALVRCVRCAVTVARGGINAFMCRYFQRISTWPSSIVLLLWVDLDATIMFSWTQTITPPNGILIGSATFAQLNRVRDTQTETSTYRLWQTTIRATSVAIGCMKCVKVIKHNNAIRNATCRSYSYTIRIHLLMMWTKFSIIQLDQDFTPFRNFSCLKLHNANDNSNTHRVSDQPNFSYGYGFGAETAS